MTIEIPVPVEAGEQRSVDAAAALMHGLADRTRLRIVQHLLLGEHRVVDLTAHLGLAQSTVSAHLACLRDCGLIESRAVGRSSHYRLAHPEATTELLMASEHLLHLTGYAAELCPQLRAEEDQTQKAKGP